MIERTPKVSICIPSYNQTSIIKEVLDNVLECTSPDIDFEIILSHNGSRPRGFCYTVNLVCFASKADIVVVLSDDVVVTKGWLPPLIKGVTEEGYATACPIVYTDPGPNRERYNLTPNSCCQAYKRTVYEELKGHNERFYQNNSEWEQCTLLRTLYGDMAVRNCLDCCVYHLGTGERRSANWMANHPVYQEQCRLDNTSR